MLKRLADGLNWCSDQDWEWWPLLRYRPPPGQCISNAVVVRLTLFFGTVSGILIAAIAGHLRSVVMLPLDVLVGWLAFFAIYRSTFVPAWNARARRLQAADGGQPG